MSESESKEILLKKIKEWISLDNEATKLTKEVKALKSQKKELSEFLLNVMKDNNIDCFNTNGGSLVYKKNKVKKSLNSKSLLDTLKMYFKEETDEGKAMELSQFILNNRNEDVKESIKRKM